MKKKEKNGKTDARMLARTIAVFEMG